MRRNPPVPPDWHEVVRAHWHETDGYVVAASGDYPDVQADETLGKASKVPGREFRAHRPEQLKGFQPVGSWFMGILLCPGDDVGSILAWTAGLARADAERVVFYAHPAFDRAATAGWHTSARPRVAAFKGTWADFHQLYGFHHGDRVYQDHSMPRPS